MQAKLTNEILQALVAADYSRKMAALRILRGERRAQPPSRGTDPLALSINQTAKLLNISRFTVRKMMLQGRLKTFELLPGLMRIRRTDVEALMGGAP